MTVEEFLESNNVIVVDDEYTDETIAQAYEAGYNEAKRWRKPEDELPKYYEKVQLKISNNDVIDYVNACLLAEDDGTLFFGDYSFNIFIKFESIIGWREIE